MPSTYGATNQSSTRASDIEMATSGDPVQHEPGDLQTVKYFEKPKKPCYKKPGTCGWAMITGGVVFVTAIAALLIKSAKDKSLCGVDYTKFEARTEAGVDQHMPEIFVLKCGYNVISQIVKDTTVSIQNCGLFNTSKNSFTMPGHTVTEQGEILEQNCSFTAEFTPH